MAAKVSDSLLHTRIMQCNLHVIARGNTSNKLRWLNVLRATKPNRDESLRVLSGLLIDEIVERLPSIPPRRSRLTLSGVRQASVNRIFR
jgi:hypothetical protein